MPNELNVSAVAAITGANDNAAGQQAEAFIPPAQGPPAPSATPLPNPQLRLDPALGLVVIEFRDASGALTTSIPSQRQLNAYRRWEQNQPEPGELPAPPDSGPAKPATSTADGAAPAPAAKPVTQATAVPPAISTDKA